MISSGIKRGLAASAVSALAVAGLPLLATSASAEPLADQVGPGAVVLHTPDDGGAASIKNDGANTTVHLLANGGTAVTQVRFEFSVNGLAPFTTIATVGRSNGAFSTEWTPPVSVYNLPVHVRAVAIDSVGVDGAVDDNIATVTSNQDGIDLTEAPGSAVGVFQQPYAAANNKLLGAASATTSDVAGDPAVTFSAPYGGAARPEDTVGTPANGARTVSGPVDYTGYDFGSAVDVDQAIEEANVGGATGGSDAEAVTLYQQTITTVTAAATSPTVQQGGTTSITVTVTDQNGKAVVGAEVFQDDNQDNTGDAAAKYTNSQGKAVFTTQGGSPSGTTHYFFVNTTGTVTYENGTDFKRSATVTEYVPAAASITATSADGAAFDDDEYVPGDIKATVKDQNGAGMAGQIVRYAWTVTPFAATVGYPKTLPEASATTDGSGVAQIVFPTGEPSGTYVLHTYINQDGTPGQGTGDLGGTDLTVKAGQADIVWEDGASAQAPAGATSTFEGALELEDGTGLPARNAALNWAPTGDAVVAAQGSQPAGTTRTGNNSATTVTGTDGSFGVALSDPTATPNVAELNGTLSATTTNTPNIGNAVDSSSLDVDFLADSNVSDVQTTTSKSDLSSSASPGRPVEVEITVENAAGTALTDLDVELSTDHGFFTTADATQLSELVADPAAADGANYGEWEDLGDSYTAQSDDSGVVHAVVAIERDAGFDDDGQVTANVTFEVGGETFTEPVVFDSSNPLNPGEVRIVLDDSQSVSDATLPNAPVTESLAWDVEATDQFGNLTDEPVAVTDGSSPAELRDDNFNLIGNGSTVTSNFTDQDPALNTTSDVSTNQTITGTWNADTLVWNDLDDVTAGFQGDTDVADSTTAGSRNVVGTSEAISWYAIDYANSTFTLTHSGADTQPVGTTVTETYTAVDQNGEPIAGLDVQFFRTGPDDLGDGDGNSFSETNANGQAFYVFQGAKAGTATITAVLREQDGQGGVPTGDLIPQGEKTDQVSFGGQPPVASNINLQLAGKDNGKKADKLTANAKSNASGLVAKLYKKVNGSWTLVKSGALNADGNRKFKVADKNGKAKTKYQVRVAASDTTNADKANKAVR